MSQKQVYMLYDENGYFENGPYLGEPGLDFSLLATRFRDERYAAAEARKDEDCLLLEQDFIRWMIEEGVLVPMEVARTTIALETQGKNRYAPAHWPSCPVCQAGRGEEMPGRILRDLNRWDWHRKCTVCAHEWDYQDRPWDSGKPMLEDDGRYIVNGCVPYAISQAGGLPIDEVVRVCREYGWREFDGMCEDHGLLAATAIGLQLSPKRIPGTMTLRQFLNQLDLGKTYIVSTRDHWLAVVKGENRDVAKTSMRVHVLHYWEVSDPKRSSSMPC